MRVYLDTNILIDLLDTNRVHHEDATYIFEMAKEGRLEAFLSSQSVLDTIYTYRKAADPAMLRASLLAITQFIHIAPIGLTEISKALQSEEPDIEDAAQAITADSQFCHLIISNDKGFPYYPKDWPITVMSSKVFVDTCKRLESAEPQMG